MSNIGKKPVTIQPGVDVKVEKDQFMVTGPKGTLMTKLPHGVVIDIVDGVATIKKQYESKSLEKYIGLIRALLSNMVTGVSTGFEKKLELQGVGYRARVDGMDLVLNVGFANPVKMTPPQGITFQVAEGVITVAGIDKQLIGDVCAKVRAVRPPDPYKGKGIRYVGEVIKKKVGKAAKAVGK
jgi:large subunit ribosomal protein L6